ncbi:MFS transporter [Alistipes sp. An54]|uniref:MFS transporter n=1 Tax=Alistipes sp. An54 TaxID=1965645 RepID=UPI000B3AAEEA|nr:MFS transporter [Alistipes sp. An54]OUN76387.1 MFS transporter [Alistipes sp. An54]
MSAENWKHTFAVIWSGQAVSILSSSIVAYAIIFWMSVETRSAEVLALSAMAGMLPQAVLGLFVGVYIDRWDRKRTMILADSFIALCTLGLAALFWSGRAELWHVYVLLACRSVGTAFHVPAMQASVPLLAPERQLTRIAGVNQVISSFSDLAGPALGALLLGLTSIGNILLLDVVGALIACTTLLFVRIPNPERPERKADLWRELREGFAAMHSQPGLGWFFVLAIAIWFLIMPVGVMFPLMTLNHFGGGTWEMSFVEIIWGGGALLGGAIMGARNYPINRIVLINLMYIVVGLSFLLSGLLPPTAFCWFAVLTAAAGVSSSVFNASFVAVLQTRIEAGLLGRVLSLYRSFGLLPSALGLLSTGFLAEQVGLTTTFVLSGGAICLLGSVAFCLPSVLRLDRHPEQPDSSSNKR